MKTTLRRNPSKTVARKADAQSAADLHALISRTFGTPVLPEAVEAIQKYPSACRVRLIAFLGGLRRLSAGDGGVIWRDEVAALVKALRTSARQFRRLERHPLVKMLLDSELTALADSQEALRLRFSASLGLANDRALQARLRDALWQEVSAALGSETKPSQVGKR